MTILSASDRTFWEENGYVIIRNAVPKEDCSAVVDAIWEFLDMDRNNPETWYSKPAWHSRAGMIEMYHHQSMWNNRQNPKVHQAFSEIYGSDKLWVSLDRVNMNPPATADWDYQGFIHWDIDPTVQPVPLRTQGVLCLADTNEAQGGFQCIPGSHLHVAEIVAAQAPNSHDWRNTSPCHPPTKPMKNSVSGGSNSGKIACRPTTNGHFPAIQDNWKKSLGKPQN